MQSRSGAWLRRHSLVYIIQGTVVDAVQLTLWRPLLPHGYSYKASCEAVTDRVKPSFVIFDMLALWRSGLSIRVPGCQKLQMTT